MRNPAALRAGRFQTRDFFGKAAPRKSEEPISGKAAMFFLGRLCVKDDPRKSVDGPALSEAEGNR